MVFHIVTDSLNFPAISMWFLLNPPGKAAIHVQNVDNFDWLHKKYGMGLQQQGSIDPRYSNALNHLRFYLPDVFPFLNKVVLLDHDIVVQKDLTGLWSIDMKGKVNGALETCWEGEPSFRRMDTFINFTDPIVAKKFDAKTCTWAFGVNLFDLQEWRKQDVTEIYHRYMRLVRIYILLTEILLVYIPCKLACIEFYEVVTAVLCQTCYLFKNYIDACNLLIIELESVILSLPLQLN